MKNTLRLLAPLAVLALTSCATAPSGADLDKLTAEIVKARVAQSGLWKRPITTEIAPEAKWWTAEGAHQDYLRKHPHGYNCHYMR